MGKDGRCLRQRDREVGEMPTATTVMEPAVCGSQALERRILRKAYVRCGEGRTEKGR